VTCGQTPVLDPAEGRALLDSIDVSKHAGLRDRALIWLMVYSFARIGAALGMAIEDVFTQNRRLWVRLREASREYGAGKRWRVCSRSMWACHAPSSGN
jgi:integrase